MRTMPLKLMVSGLKQCGIEAVAIAYFIFIFTWFDCAQYAHIAWWAMSLTAVKSASVSRLSGFRSESGQLPITN